MDSKLQNKYFNMLHHNVLHCRVTNEGEKKTIYVSIMYMHDIVSNFAPQVQNETAIVN
jgi:hypothetical protein